MARKIVDETLSSLFGTQGRINRRQLISTAAALTGSVLAGGFAAPLEAQQKLLRIVPLSDRLIALIGPNANVVAADSGGGIIMVDGGDQSWSDDLLAAVDRRFAARPVTSLFNTHWHSEQTGSNLTLGARGAEIIAHENTKLWLGTEVWQRWSDIKYPPLPEAALPTKTFYDSGSLRLGDRRVDYGYMLNAHTDGDIWVFFPEENVLVTGGLVSNEGWPVIDWWTGGWIGGMLDGFDALLEVANANTRIVPAKGPLMSLTDLRSQQQMYLTIFDRLHEMLRQALGTDEVVAARPTAEFDAQWGDPEQFVTLAFESMWGHLRDAYSHRMQNIP